MTATLWHIEVSHYNEKARWALDHKGIPHVRKAPLPGMHGAFALAVTRGGQRRLPVLQLDGRTIGDSTAIIAALETYRPDPPLYPADPGDRTRALELEDFFDEQLAPEVRRLGWQHILGDSAATVETLMPNAGATRKRMVGALVPALRPFVRRDYGVSEAGAARAVDKIRAAMDRVESEMQPSGYLVGEGFSVADLTAAALFTPLMAPPGRQYQPPTAPPAMMDLRAELDARPGGQWVNEMYERHRGRSAEVPA